MSRPPPSPSAPSVRSRLRGPPTIGALALVAAFAAWQAPPLAPPENAARGSAPTRIMGTTCRLLAVPPRTASAAEATAITNQALEGAEAALRAVEAEMSTHIDDTPLSRFNRSAVGQRISLPPATLAVLRASEEAWYDTDGAFDVTSRPLIELWRTAGRRRRAPPAEEIDATRRRSSWSGLQLGATGATKRVSGVEVDVGGVAKGWAIDRAILRMATAGATGGLVDVGGDLRVFGSPPAAGPWQVRVQDPFGDGTILTLRMAAGAICTSGDYFRFVEIDGRRLSHIVDPRTGYPAAAVHSASVVAPTATSADVWATALSVLGEAGLSRLPAGHEAMLVLGEREAPHAIATPGFPTLVVEGPPYPLAIAGR